MAPNDPNLNWQLPTLGGRQLWGDVLNFRGWRIQHNVLTGHCRLIDPVDVRHAWGTEEQCRTMLQGIKERDKLAPLTGRAVILVHGLARSSKSMTTMQRTLAEQGYLVVPFDYPSTRVTIPQSAEYLRKVVDSLEGVTEVNFVVHSMGGLIVRSYVQQTADRPDPRLNRLVMLGVPNLGARLASIAHTNALFKLIYGPAGQQLVESAAGLIATLPAPHFEFAVVSGARGTADGYNPLIPGDDDGVVSVDCTRLPGAADFMTVPGLHTFLPAHQDVVNCTVRFLRTGALRVEGIREPIVPSQATALTPQDCGV
jgi:pimeloyl-ACP methyl ester carboxylesterase